MEPVDALPAHAGSPCLTITRCPLYPSSFPLELARCLSRVPVLESPSANAIAGLDSCGCCQPVCASMRSRTRRYAAAPSRSGAATRMTGG